MICKYFNPLVLLTAAVTISQVCCDTRAVFQPHQPQQPQVNGGQVSDNFYEPISTNSVGFATPRFGGLWNPLEFLTLESLIQPAVTAIGVLVGFFGFFQITNWLLDLIAATKSLKKKTTEVKKPVEEETNEVDARRKRMLSIEVST